jgi:YD repeat-containing protein
MTGSEVGVRVRFGRWLRAGVLLSGALALLVGASLLASRHLPLSWWTVPLVLEVLARANDHPGVVELLGAPVQLGWSPTGRVDADETGWREFRVKVPVKGTRDHAALHVRAGRAAQGAWAYTTVELETDSGQRIDVLAPPRLSGLPPGRVVYLVPLGRLQYVSVEELARYHRARLGLEIRTLPPVELTAPLVDHARNQLVGEVAVEWLRWRLRSVVEDLSAVVIAISEHDMYVRGRSGRFTLSYPGDDRFAVVSVARMLPDEDTSSLVSLGRRMLSGHRLFGKEYVVHKRARRMVGQNIGFLAYRFPASPDRTSLLYANVADVADLDAMRDSFEPVSRAQALGVPVSHRKPSIQPELLPRAAPVKADGRYPCFVVRPGLAAPGDRAARSAAIDACLPRMRTEREYDEFEVDLRSGLLVACKTDLFVPDGAALALARCYRLWDEQPRAFGIGTNHPYDTFPIGSRQPYTYMKVILADGSSIHYDRISKGTGYADAVYEHVETATPFLASRFQWNGNGWDLRFQDQSLFVFPESYAATRSAEGALIEMHDRAGRVVKLNRDRRRNLIEVVAPGGGAIRFQYDSGDRVTAASDHRGQVVRYEYDLVGRLVGVLDRESRAVRYSYDGTKLVAIDAGDGQPYLRVRYFGDRVSAIRLADGRVYRFRFSFEEAEEQRAVRAVVTQPDGASTEIDLKTGAHLSVAAGR